MLAVQQNPNALFYQDVMLDAIRLQTDQQIVQTPKISGAMLDGFFVKNEVVTSCFELKYWRNTESNSKRMDIGVWFLDDYKLQSMQNASKYLSVPCYLFAGFGSCIYVFKICNSKGDRLFCFNQKEIHMNNTTMGSEKTIVKRTILEFQISNAIKTIKI
jgi:hypothetical protein